MNFRQLTINYYNYYVLYEYLKLINNLNNTILLFLINLNTFLYFISSLCSLDQGL